MQPQSGIVRCIALPNGASFGLHRNAGFATIGAYRAVGRKVGASTT